MSPLSLDIYSNKEKNARKGANPFLSEYTSFVLDPHRETIKNMKLDPLELNLAIKHGGVSLHLKVNGYSFRGKNSSIFIFASPLIGNQL